jgi:hypothetical protein
LARFFGCAADCDQSLGIFQPLVGGRPALLLVGAWPPAESGFKFGIFQPPSSANAPAQVAVAATRISNEQTIFCMAKTSCLVQCVQKWMDLAWLVAKRRARSKGESPFAAIAKS